MENKSDWIALRRERRNPNADFWHTLRIGAICAGILFLILPWALG